MKEDSGLKSTRTKQALRWNEDKIAGGKAS